MRVVYLVFDSLNRHLLEPYGGHKIPTPNFMRLQKRCVTFDRHYVGSMPCMPARRDMHTGRLSFLHRSWGPLEPFDNSVSDLLTKAGVYTHLITDHYHYFEDGGATYHTRYNSYEFVRGQEKDPWHALVNPEWESIEPKYHPAQFSIDRRGKFYPYIMNRERIEKEEDFPAVKTFRLGLEFLRRNARADGWFLQLETFSPHEPYLVPERFKAPFSAGWTKGLRDWPPYDRVKEPLDEAEELRANYCASVAMCDELLGQLLDAFEELDLWRDTVLVVTTDHGFLLGEHDFWAKNRMTMYQEVSHIPLMIAHPTLGRGGERRQALTQTIDFAPTFLEIFGVEAPPEMQGFSLSPVLESDRPLREALIYGYFGGAVNVTDGRYTYHCYPEDIASQKVFQYTLMPTHMNVRFSTEELRGAELANALAFTKNTPVLKIPVIHASPIYNNYGPGCLIEKETRLYDLATDYAQTTPLTDPLVENRMRELMRRLMKENDAPPEAFARLGLA